MLNPTNTCIIMILRLKVNLSPNFKHLCLLRCAILHKNAMVSCIKYDFFRHSVTFLHDKCI